MSNSAMSEPRNQPLVSVVLACYNEAEHLERSIGMLLETIKLVSFDVELIFVDDGSSDDTWDILEDTLRSEPCAQLLRRPANGGRGQAVTDGLSLCRGTFAGYLDVDLEIHPLYILKCIAALQSGAEAVFGKRTYPVALANLPRVIGHIGYRWLVHLVLGIRTADSESGLKFFRTSRLKDLLGRTVDRGWFWDTEIVFWSESLGLRVRDVPCLYVRDMSKRSSVRLLRDTIRYATDLATFAWKSRQSIWDLRKARENEG